MSNTIKGHCNCNAHTYTIPKPTEDTGMNLCRKQSSIPRDAADVIQIVQTAEDGLELCTLKLTHPSGRS